jgi:hypothetical protein
MLLGSGLGGTGFRAPASFGGHGNISTRMEFQVQVGLLFVFRGCVCGSSTGVLTRVIAILNCTLRKPSLAYLSH